MIKEDQLLKRIRDILLSTPGSGSAIVGTLLSELPELGQESNKKIASFLGVASHIQQSGSWIGLKHDSKLKEFYLRLKDAGKSSKVAFVAVMRKLITILNIMINRNELWKMEAA